MPEENTIWSNCFEGLKAASFARNWDGVNSIQEMFDDGAGTLQTEWQGWYAEHLFKKHSPVGDSLKIHGDIPEEHKYLDAYIDANPDYAFPVDIKTCANYRIQDSQYRQYPKEVMLNDEDNVDQIIKKYGYIGFILIHGYATPDAEYKVKEFLAEMRMKRDGKSLSEYAANNRARNRKSRLLKEAFLPLSIEIYVFNEASFGEAVSAGAMVPKKQPGLNSNGTERPRKYNFNFKKTRDIQGLEPVFWSDFDDSQADLLVGEI